MCDMHTIGSPCGQPEPDLAESVRKMSRRNVLGAMALPQRRSRLAA